MEANIYLFIKYWGIFKRISIKSICKRFNIPPSIALGYVNSLTNKKKIKLVLNGSFSYYISS